jgi:hypothetical protein
MLRPQRAYSNAESQIKQLHIRTGQNIVARNVTAQETVAEGLKDTFVECATHGSAEQQTQGDMASELKKKRTVF